MGLIVQKYGGTSVGNTERIENVANKVIGWRGRGHQVVVVVSAMSGETDRLIGLAKTSLLVPARASWMCCWPPASKSRLPCSASPWKARLPSSLLHRWSGPHSHRQRS